MNRQNIKLDLDGIALTHPNCTPMMDCNLQVTVNNLYSIKQYQKDISGIFVKSLRNPMYRKGKVSRR